MMNRIRPRQKRSLRFEALEGRLALSTGMAGGVVAHHAHVLVTKPALHKVRVSFSGHASESGSTVTITNLKGTIGTVHFTGNGTGTISGKTFKGGDVNLSNSEGSVMLQLSPQAGKGARQTIAVSALEATGNYAQYVGDTGTLTSWNISTRPTATSTFGGVFYLK